MPTGATHGEAQGRALRITEDPRLPETQGPAAENPPTGAKHGDLGLNEEFTTRNMTSKKLHIILRVILHVVHMLTKCSVFAHMTSKKLHVILHVTF